MAIALGYVNMQEQMFFTMKKPKDELLCCSTYCVVS